MKTREEIKFDLPKPEFQRFSAHVKVHALAPPPMGLEDVLYKSKELEIKTKWKESQAWIEESKINWFRRDVPPLFWLGMIALVSILVWVFLIRRVL